MNIDLLALAAQAAWGGLMAAGIAVFFTTPRDALLVAALCGALGRVARSLALGAEASVVTATLLAAAAVAVAAMLLAPRRGWSPVVAMAALIPLGAAGNAFNVVWASFRIAAGDYASRLALLASDVVTNSVTLVAVTLAIAIGFLVPWLVVHSANRARR